MPRGSAATDENLKKFPRPANRATQALTSMTTFAAGSSNAQRMASSAMQPPNPATRIADFTSRPQGIAGLFATLTMRRCALLVIKRVLRCGARSARAGIWGE
jgi:hypothetical protein